MNNFITIIIAIIAALLALLGVEKHKSKKKDSIIKRQAQDIATKEKLVEVHEVLNETQTGVVEETKKVEQEQHEQEERIEEASDDEEVIGIANDIVDRFNAK